MTREHLLARLELDRADALRQGWRTALVGVALIAGAGWCVYAGGITPGPVFAFTAGAMVVMMALARQFAPKPSYGGGRLEARSSPVGLLMAVALIALLASAFVWALSLASLFRRVEFLALLSLIAVMFAVNWALTLGPGPVVTIDSQGYRDRRATRGPIPWDQLEPVDVRVVRNQTFYRLCPRDVTRLNGVARLNALVGFTGFAISGVGLDHGAGDMLLAIQAYRPDLLDAL